MSDLNEGDTHPHVFLPTRPTGCQAFAAKPRAQCGFRIARGERFCRHHTLQDGNCCRAITRNGKRCLGSITAGGRGYFCEMHQDWATPDEMVCKGSKVRNGLTCYRRVLDTNYRFCSTKHDGRTNYCDPNLFHEEGLRGRVLSQLRERDADRDRYNPGTRILGSVENYQVDHRIETQMFSFFWQFDIFQDTEEKRDVMTCARDEFVNTLPNLLVTRTRKRARQ